MTEEKKPSKPPKGPGDVTPAQLDRLLKVVKSDPKRKNDEPKPKK